MLILSLLAIKLYRFFLAFFVRFWKQMQCIVSQPLPFLVLQNAYLVAKIQMVLLKFWYIYVSKFEETFICKREIDALPPIIRFAVFILLTEPSRIPLFNLLAIELLMAE